MVTQGLKVNKCKFARGIEFNSSHVSCRSQVEASKLDVIPASLFSHSAFIR